MYEKELPIGDRITNQDSLDLDELNFSSRLIRTRFGRVISLSHRALASYQQTNTFLKDSQLLHFYASGFSFEAGGQTFYPVVFQPCPEFLTREYAKRRTGFLLGLRYANVSLAHSGVESS